MNKIMIFCEQNEDKKSLPGRFSENKIECFTPGQGEDFDFLSPDIIVVGANVMLTLLNVILAYIQNRRDRQISIKGEAGWQVEIPAETSEEKLKEYIKLATQNNADRIIISSK